MSDERDYRKVYEEYWKPIIERGGEPSMDQIMRELSDYKFLLENVPKVYMHVSGGKLSYPNYHAQVVISAADEWLQDSIDEALEDMHTEHHCTSPNCCPPPKET